MNKKYEFMETAGLGYWRKKKTDWQEIGVIAAMVGMIMTAIYLSI